MARRERCELEIVAVRLVTFLGGYCEGHVNGKRVQVTQVRYRGVTAYVREWRSASSWDSFVLSSNARLGHKADGNRIGCEVLQLAAPAAAWDAIAAAVRELDALRRPVQRHQRWTLKTAPIAMSGAVV